MMGTDFELIADVHGGIRKTLPPEFQRMTASAPVIDHKSASTVRNTSAQ